MTRIAALPRRPRTRVARWVRVLIGVVAFAVVLQIITVLSPVNPLYLPDASTTMTELGSLLVDPIFLGRLLRTLGSWLAGLAIATAIAIPLGILMGTFGRVYRAVHTPLELLRPIPAVALIPLFILVMGQSFQANLWLIVYACIWPILLNTIYGVHDVTLGAQETARSFGLNQVETLLRVVLPSALPLIFTGIRVAGAIALTVAVAAEMLVVSTGGLGSFIQDASQSGGSMAPSYAAVAAAGLLGLLTNWVLVRLERAVCPWRRGTGTSE